MSIDYLKFKGGHQYRLIKVPGHNSKIDTDGWPALGAIGECSWVSTINGVCMTFGSNEVIIPFDCLEEPTGLKKDLEDVKTVINQKIDDSILITVMLDNPVGVYKLLRGLWRVTKHITIRDLMERGILPPDEKDQYNKNWDDYDDYCKLTGALSNEGGLMCSD